MACRFEAGEAEGEEDQEDQGDPEGAVVQDPGVGEVPREVAVRAPRENPFL